MQTLDLYNTYTSVGSVRIADDNGTVLIPTEKLNNNLVKGIIKAAAINENMICPLSFSNAFKKTAPQYEKTCIIINIAKGKIDLTVPIAMVLLVHKLINVGIKQVTIHTPILNPTAHNNNWL